MSKTQTIFTNMSIFLSIASLLLSCTFYGSFVCGSLGIIMAFLSKGGEERLSIASKRSVIISIIGMASAAIILIASFATVILQYGSIENLMRAYEEMLNGAGGM